MTQRRLILGPVKADELGKDIVFGPWCLIGDDRLLDDWRAFDFPDPFQNPNDWAEAQRMCMRLANMLVPIWAERLNTLHGTTLSLAFWRVMLINWLTWAIPPLWYRWRYAEEFIRRHVHEDLEVLARSDAIDWDLPNSESVYERIFLPDEDVRLSSLILRALAPSTWRFVELPPLPPIPPVSANSPPARETMLGAIVKRIFGRLPVQSVPGHRLAKLPLSALVAMLPRRPGYSFWNFSDQAALEYFPQTALSLLDQFLQWVLPRTFRQDFSPLLAAAQLQSYVPGRLLLDQLSASDDGYRMGIALACASGERLVSCQHGGTYGTARSVGAFVEMDYPYHAFLTWGWREQEDYRGNFVSLPSPGLSRLRNRHRETSDVVVMVGGSMPVRGARLGFLPSPHNMLRYREAKRDFVAALSPPVRNRVYYRPYRRGLSDLPDEAYMRGRFSDLKTVDGDLDAALLGCRLAVIDHPITTMLTALAANVPTILYWEKEAWPLARQAEPLFQRLRDVGILHHDAAAAAAQVNRVWDDVPAWWRRPEVQEARRAFTRTYARTSRLWWWHWVKALWALARAKGDGPPARGNDA